VAGNYTVGGRFDDFSRKNANPDRAELFVREVSRWRATPFPVEDEVIHRLPLRERVKLRRGFKASAAS
jgi:hypothetical protein